MIEIGDIPWIDNACRLGYFCRIITTGFTFHLVPPRPLLLLLLHYHLTMISLVLMALLILHSIPLHILLL